jgi:hypothetical protein
MDKISPHNLIVAQDEVVVLSGDGRISPRIFGKLDGNFSVTLTLWSHLLRKSFEFERSCFHMRQKTQTKREQGRLTVNERLRKALC